MTGGYLTFFPQFCREPVNDRGWYSGFTDWDLIKPLSPLMRRRFTPAEGMYDLSNPEVIARQFAAIRASKWGGIALYHYFFNGQFVLDSVERYIVRGGSEVPAFFLIWANETWTKRWLGKPSEVIIEQQHSVGAEIVKPHVARLCELMRHPSYVRIEGRPVLILYSVYEIPQVGRLIDAYRNEFAARGENPLIGFCVSYVDTAFSATAFDMVVEFQPRLFFNMVRARRANVLTKVGTLVKRQLPGIYGWATGLRDAAFRSGEHPRFVFPYDEYLDMVDADRFHRVLQSTFGLPVVRSSFYSWNNFPRYRGSALVVSHRAGELERFNALCEQWSRSGYLYLVNSWNEWSEGAALEPGVEPADAFDMIASSR